MGKVTDRKEELSLAVEVEGGGETFYTLQQSADMCLVGVALLSLCVCKVRYKVNSKLHFVTVNGNWILKKVGAQWLNCVVQQKHVNRFCPCWVQRNVSLNPCVKVLILATISLVPALRA